MSTPRAAGRWRPGEVTGAFSDAAVLFPLLLALAWQTGAEAVPMLATTGIAYLLTGWLFRLPIPVQPLKSLSLMAIAVGASAAEIQLAGLLLGAIYLGFSLLRDLDRIAARIPDVLVHGFQLGLGVLLVVTAARMLDSEPADLLLLGAAATTVVLITRWTGWPVLGGIAVAGMLWGIAQAGPSLVTEATAGEALRVSVVGLMVLPQIALTLTNSVLGTERAARAYYGAAAYRVTPRRLLSSLGAGNLLVGAVGGMPYCHGSGGVTAHYRGGARSWHSNALIGGTLLAMAAWLQLGGGGLPAFPPVLQALLIAVIGVYHLRLAAPSWRVPEGRLILLGMAAAALVAQNMLAVLTVGLLGLAIRHGLVARCRVTPDSERSDGLAMFRRRFDGH